MILTEVKENFHYEICFNFNKKQLRFKNQKLRVLKIFHFNLRPIKKIYFKLNIYNMKKGVRTTEVRTLRWFSN